MVVFLFTKVKLHAGLIKWKSYSLIRETALWCVLCVWTCTLFPPKNSRLSRSPNGPRSDSDSATQSLRPLLSLWKIRIICLSFEMWCLSSGGNVCKGCSMVFDIIKTQYIVLVLLWVLLFSNQGCLAMYEWNIHIWRACRFCIWIGSMKHLDGYF